MTFSEALQRLGPTPIDPRTGEIIDLPECDHTDLVGAFMALAEYEKQLKAWRTQVEDELVRRHGDKRHAQTIGNHEVDVDRGYSRAWDAEDLLETVGDLVGRGLLTVMDAQGLVKDEPKVDGRKAAALLSRLDGEALVELRRCFEWEVRGRAKVRVTPVVELEA